MSQFSSLKKTYTVQESVYKLAEFGKLSSGLFHDLMHPITWLLLEIDNLQYTQQQKTQYKSLIESRKSLQDYIQNMRKLLSFENQITEFDIKKEINSSLQVLQYKIRSQAISVRFNMLQKIVYTGNPFTFYQVITNLISNAIDAHDNSRHSKKIISIKVAQRKKSVSISITDSGCGIAKSELQRIFKPFVSTKKGPNLGLGLSITKDIIEKEYRGKISITSERNKGTTFSISLPYT